MRRIVRNKEFWIAIGINLLFLFFYVYLCHPYYETSDDNGMAFFVEGAYGFRTGHLVFENIIWGKFLSLLSAILPGIKWYTVCMYMGMFCANAGISYYMLKVGGIRAGFLGCVLLLIISGVQSYIIFQWSRVTAIITVGGMLLLFYGIEYAKNRQERMISLAMGFALCIFGSLIRFQYFAVCVVLSGGIVLLRFLRNIKEHAEGWKKRLGMYVLTFGIMGIVSIVCYSADQAYYLRDESWRYYEEYNELRSELWDYGFPDYTKNRELYDSLGISMNDMEYYRTWNMDEELMPIESLRALVDAKEKKSFSSDLVKGYVKDVSQYLLSIPLFGIFLAVSIISIVLNKKRLVLVFYEFIAIMAFELYFYYIGRFGLARIDMMILVAGIIVILCGMLEDLRKITFRIRWLAALAGIFVFVFMSTFIGRIFTKQGDYTWVSNFVEILSEDKEHLYCMGYSHKDPYKLFLNLYDFWTPAQEGDLSNVYYFAGWEFNVPVKKALLAEYGVSNPYRDAINNSTVRLIANDEIAGAIERYIQENYDDEISLYLLKDIEPFKIWGIRSRDIILEEEMNKNLEEIVHQVNVEKKSSALDISGYIYKKDSNSFQQCAYLKLRNLSNKEIIYKELTMSPLQSCTDLMNGKYSYITGNFNIEKGNIYDISIILKADDEFYELPIDVQ